MGWTGRWGLSLASIVIAVALSGCWWGQSRFSAGWTSYNPYERVLTAAQVDGITELWSVPAPMEGWPLVSWRNRVFAGYGNAVHAFDARSGQEVWQAPSRDSNIFWVRDGALYVTDRVERALMARDASTGARLPEKDIRIWGETVDDRPADPVVMGDRYGLVTGVVRPGERDQSGTLRLYDWQTGTSTLLPALGYTGPLDEAGSRYYTLDPGYPDRIAARSFAGEELWRREMSLSFPTALVADGGRLYVGNRYVFDNDGFDVLDSATGAEVWHGNVPGDMVQPAVRDGVVYTGLGMVDDGRLLAYEDCGEPSCDPIWTGRGSDRVASVIAAGDLVYATTRDQAGETWTIRIYAAGGCGAATCRPLETIRHRGSTPLGTPIVSGGRLFVPATDGLRAYGLRR